MSLLVEKITQWMDKLVSLIILLVMLRLVLYMLSSLYASAQRVANGTMWLTGHDAEILDWVVFFIIMVKAYKVLVSYTKYQHISIRYITELVIITCFLEFIFEQDINEQIRIILGAVGIGTLFLYLYFYQTIKDMDNGH
ncbi:MAG: hypothetical protein ABGX71_11250 [Methyloprofundus sp.]|uniref:hypothetical protein n=1 Tax=Methyloprofundus sp. TaxID=2020875 RepID=UPI001A13FE50|nr:hypothetical protein [Methyloprofundus sp.]HIL77758.1 hypothetical protein [Methylococcales bacterium]